MTTEHGKTRITMQTLGDLKSELCDENSSIWDGLPDNTPLKWVSDRLCRALGGASLRGVSLRDAGMRDADMRGAYLRGADLRGANIRGT